MHSSRLRPPLVSCGCKMPCMRRAVVLPLLLRLLPTCPVVPQRGVDRRRRVNPRRVVLGCAGLVGPGPADRCPIRPPSGAPLSPSPARPLSRREHPERRDLFLCHAWDDREDSASDLYDRLKYNGATVWFSEKDVALGKQLIREIDKGLRNSRVGIVLVTPALLKSIEAEGIAEKELSVLLASGRVIPVAHGTTFEAFRDVSPMLASHAGLDTAESSLDDVAAKIAAAAAALAVDDD